MDENKRNKILEMTIEAFKKINKKRFYKSERGYQGRLLCALYFLMDEVNIFSEDTIIEQEYQKGTSSHGTTQRPDIIIHVPVEHSGARITENNYVVYALKKNTSDIDAQDDFNKLDDMFNRLNYELGIFVSINKYPKSFLHLYEGNNKNKLHEFSLKYEDNKLGILYRYFIDGSIEEQDYGYISI
ncbi:MAG TPA: hypothetical protein PLK11_04165 [Methanofastidiosum sp.]|nr:hypothetical protein [Methanofastidiosum sp.]HOR88380.1 hypothetical protein [Methanofastidiosum sp.]HPL00524.1 hypothetical protein [Methanofastidiosum sp.]